MDTPKPQLKPLGWLLLAAIALIMAAVCLLAARFLHSMDLGVPGPVFYFLGIIGWLISCVFAYQEFIEMGQRINEGHGA